MNSGCKCPACVETEMPSAGDLPPYRFEPGRVRTVFHLALHASLPLAGMAWIGLSWWMAVPVIGALAAYLANSFILCPACAYHHAGLRFCGCYPKSVFSQRTYLGKRWGLRENVLGRGAAVLLTVGPTSAVLAAQGAVSEISALLVQAVVVIFLTSVFSCPGCRQREVCALGRLTIAGIRRKNL